MYLERIEAEDRDREALIDLYPLPLSSHYPKKQGLILIKFPPNSKPRKTGMWYHPTCFITHLNRVAQEVKMVSAIVLLKIERDVINTVANQLANINGISEVFSVAGRYDLVAILRVNSNNALADLVTSKMLKVEGILDSETMISFKAYSQHDLESMFDIGLDD